MKKPASVIIVQTIIIIKSVILLLLLLGFCVSLNLNNEIANGIREGLRITNLDTHDLATYFFQIIGIPIFLVILSLVFLLKRNYKGLIIIFVIQLLTSITSISASLFIIIQLLIITLSSNAKNYLKPIKENPYF